MENCPSVKVEKFVSEIICRDMLSLFMISKVNKIMANCVNKVTSI